MYASHNMNTSYTTKHFLCLFSFWGPFPTETDIHTNTQGAAHRHFHHSILLSSLSFASLLPLSFSMACINEG